VIDVAVVSTVFNRPNFTHDSFMQLQATTRIPFLHVVVDDASAQPTRDVVDQYAQQYERIHVIRHIDDNIGNRPSWNEGVQWVLDEHPEITYLVTADNDVSYKDRWLEYGVKVFETFKGMISIGIVCLHNDPLYKVQKRVMTNDLEIGIKDCTPSWNWIMELELIRGEAGLYKGGIQSGRHDRDHKYCRRLYTAGYPVVALLRPGPFVHHEGHEKNERYTSVDRSDPYRRGKQPIDRGPTG